MKLVRYGEAGKEKPGILDAQGAIRDLSGVVKDIESAAVSPEGLAKLRGVKVDGLPKVSGNPRLGPPIANVPKLICIGLNYADHAKESNLPIPAEPVVFMKAISAITGPNDDVKLPKGSKKGDWEVELAFVIGKKAQSVTEADALNHVAGYMICNDVSEREWQLEHGSQWSKGKSFDTFAPLGPWFVTADEIKDPQNLSMWLDVNGQRKQTGNTNTMIFGVKEAGFLPVLHVHADARRRDQHRHSSRCRHGHQARAPVPQVRRRDAPGNRRPGRAEAESARRLTPPGIGEKRRTAVRLFCRPIRAMMPRKEFGKHFLMMRFAALLALGAFVAGSAMPVEQELGPDEVGISASAQITYSLDAKPKPERLDFDFRVDDSHAWINDDGDFQVSGWIKHTGLRCATYSMGVRFGVGAPGCLNVEWITEPLFVTSDTTMQ